MNNSIENSNRAASHDFQTALRLLEERLRNLEESEDIINGLLQGAAEFYGAARASVVEADWDLKIGLLTYEWCAEGVEHQKDMLQYLAVESFPRWCKFLSLNRPVVIPDMEAIRDTYPDEYQFFQRYGVKSILAAPFSKRINQGYIAVDDPTRFQDDPTFLFIISYAVVVELNEIKLSQSIAAAQRASKYSDHDVYVNCLGDLEIRNAKGTLTEEDISSDLCLNLFALIITNMKRALKIERLADALWPGDVMDNPYRSVSNIAYRLRRILSIIDLEDLIVGRHGTFVINPEYNVYTDFDRFEDNCYRMEAEVNPKAQSELYQGAVELYRGDLFSKISYQHWLMPKTAYYHNIFLRIIKCYIERKMEQGDYCAAHRAVVDAMSLDAQYAVSIDRLLQTRREQRQLDRKQAQRRLQTLQSRKAQLDERLQDLYERLVEGEISRESFAAQKKVLTAQTEEITCTVLELERKISGSDDNSNAVIEQFKSYAGITALTKEISADLLQSVTIYPDGRMDIRLNLADEIKALMETLHREFCTA